MKQSINALSGVNGTGDTRKRKWQRDQYFSENTNLACFYQSAGKHLISHQID